MAIQSDEQADDSRQPSALWLWLFAAVIALSVVALCVNPSRANDLFWQLRTGQEMVQSHHLPHQDTYSWTRPGTPWVVHEWLSFVVFYTAYQAANGFAGIWLLEALVLAATFLIVFFTVYRETDRAPLTAFLLTAAAGATSAIFFQPRPQIFTYFFVAATMALLLKVRRNRKASGVLWCLPPLYALWANLHAGVLIGAGVLAVCALADALAAAMRPAGDVERRAKLSEAARLGLVTVACIAATLATPYGWRVYQNFGATIGNTTAMDLVSEWASPNFHDAFGKVFEALLALILLGLICTRQTRTLAEVVVILVVTHAALGANRNVPLFALIAVPLAARHLQSMATASGGLGAQIPASLQSCAGRRPTPIAAVLAGVCVLSGALVHAAMHWRKSPDTAASPLEHAARVSVVLSAYPEHACEFLIAQGVAAHAEDTRGGPADPYPRANGKIYNIYGDGGFLIWRMPQYPVFIDGRADVYFGRLLNDYAKMKKLPTNFMDVLSPYDADIVLSSTSEAQAKLFMGSPDWALVYADSPRLDIPAGADQPERNSLVFIRRGKDGGARIARYRSACPVFSKIAGLDEYRGWAALR